MSETITHINKKTKLVPELRFKEFDGKWDKTRLGLISEIKRGAGSQYINYVPSEIDGIRLIRIGDFLGSEPVYVEHTKDIDRFRLRERDILIAGTGATAGITFLVPNEFIGMAFSYNAPRITVRNGDERFVVFYLKSEFILRQQQRLFTGNAQPFLDTKAIGNFKISIPSLPEQQKIASFLSAVDEKIQQLTHKKELLEDYKKGVMQQIFSQQIRFKDENGNDFPEWEEVSMQDVFERVTRKNKEDNQNVLTISAQMGLVNQEDYFNRSVSAADVTGYYLLQRGDFAYNKSYSKGYPMGAIKRLEYYDKGVVSTLYICFRIKGNDVSDFYKEFLDHGGINHGLYKIVQEGARNHGLLNMSVVEFFRDIKIPRPSVEEQKVIGHFLNDLSNRIDQATKQLTQTQTYKKGLLQKMFV